MSHHHHCHSHDHHHNCCCEHEHHHRHNCCCEHEHCCNGHHHQYDDFSSQLLEIADEAWLELMMEKIKKVIEKTNGSQMDQLAKVVAKTNKKCWESKVCTNECKEDYRKTIKDFLESNKS